MLNLEEFRKNGVLKVENFVSERSLQELTAEFDKVITTGTNPYPPGKMARLGRAQFNSMPKTVSTFEQPMFVDFAKQYLGQSLSFMLQIFLTLEDKVLPKEQWARNQHPHFDPYYALKFLLFLTDVTRETGAFACVPGTVQIGRELRGRNSLEKNLRTDSYTLGQHPDYAYLADQLIYMEGKAGMLLIIDTDMIHGGGIMLKKGAVRKVINVHNRKR